MAITFGKYDLGRAWDHPDNNTVFIDVPGDPDSWRAPRRRLTANESNIETIIARIPAGQSKIMGDGVEAVATSVASGSVVVVKGIHPDRLERHLGKHITVQLGAPYLDTYLLYGKYHVAQLSWIVSYISKGMPLKINY